MAALLEGLSEEVLHNVATLNSQPKSAIDACANIMVIKKLFYLEDLLILEVFAKELGIDYVHANKLEIVDGKLTGKYIGEIVNGEKSRIFKAIAKKR
jgi:phosphoserine phosphatase